MITTIQLNENIKTELNRMKVFSNETYEDVIVKMIEDIRKQKKIQTELLIEGCKIMAKDSIKMVEDFQYVDSDLEW